MADYISQYLQNFAPRGTPLDHFYAGQDRQLDIMQQQYRNQVAAQEMAMREERMMQERDQYNRLLEAEAEKRRREQEATAMQGNLTAALSEIEKAAEPRSSALSFIADRYGLEGVDTFNSLYPQKIAGNNMITVNPGGKTEVTDLLPKKTEGDISSRLQGEVLLDYLAAKGDPTAQRAVAARRATGGGVSVNPKAPSGYRYTPEGDLEPIKGGPADVKTAAAEQAKIGQVSNIDTTIDAGRALLSHPGRLSATGGSAILNSVALPGTDRASFLRRHESFIAQQFLPMVSQMKGMGALSDAEGKKLVAAATALDPSMPEAEYEAEVNRLIGELEAKKSRIMGGGKQPDNAPSKTVVSRQKLANGKTGIIYSDGTREVE